MDYQPEKLPNRRQYWENRRGLSVSSSSESSPMEAASTGESSADITIDHINSAVSGLKSCPNCGNNASEKLRQVIVDTSDSLTLIECLKCNTLIGQDDTTSPDNAKAWLRSLPVELCDCGNGDTEKFIVRERNGYTFLNCEVCNKEISIHKHGAELLRDEESEMCNLQCQCGNDAGVAFSVYAVNDTILAIQCLVCDTYAYTQCLDDFPEVETSQSHNYADSHVTVKEAEQSKISGRAQVKDTAQLREADHVAWWRPEQYWHHALVKDVNPDTDEITVIHYNGPSPAGHKIKGKIVEETLAVKKQDGVFYRMIYDGPCLPSEMAIIRATTRLGEASYNFFTNNCEHFVRWCKTGASICEQVNNAVKSAGDFAKNMGGYFSGKLLRHAFTKLMAAALVPEVAAPVGSIATDVATTSAKHMCKVGAAVVIGLEIGTALWDINKARKQRLKGDISRQEFTNVVVRRSSQCVLRGSGTIVGGYIGSMLIPIPVVGTLIGSSLGALLGHYAGSGVGYLYAKNQ